MAFIGTQWNANSRGFTPPSPTSAYRIRMGECEEDVIQAQRLRFRVFNLELGEGLAASSSTGRDVDAFDAVCEHLLVEHVNTGEVIGTYRLQTGERAQLGIGYYSAQEFDFTPFEPVRGEVLELGRACIAREHRNMVVLGLLWKGIAQYGKINGSRYLIGCSSINTIDAADGEAAFRLLAGHLAEARFITSPTLNYRWEASPSEDSVAAAMKQLQIPRLMRAYLTLGARICGAPALDRAFGTVDFLTLMDLRSLGPRAMAKFLS